MFKAKFLARQRRTVAYSHKFIIANRDLAKAHKAKKEKFEKKEEVQDICKVIDGFNPETNDNDRRLLYEVTGLRLYQDEYIDEDSSASDDESMLPEGYNNPALDYLDDIFDPRENNVDGEITVALNQWKKNPHF